MQNSRSHFTNNLNFCTTTLGAYILPKFDELHISVNNHQPDVFCITESWLCSDIHDPELILPSYQSLRFDRNRHGGGVLMYFSHKYILSSYPSLELLTVTVHCGKRRICVSLFYHPPSSSVYVLHSLHSYLESLLSFSVLNLLVTSI